MVTPRGPISRKKKVPNDHLLVVIPLQPQDSYSYSINILDVNLIDDP